MESWNFAYDSDEAAYHQKVGRFVARLQQRLEIPNVELADHLGIPQGNLSLIFTGKQAVELHRFSFLANRYHFTLEAFDRNEVDFNALARLDSEKPIEIPEAYRLGAKSRIRAIRNIFNRVDSFLGPSQAALFLRRFQLSARSFGEPETPVNVNLVENSLTFIRGMGFSENQIRRIGEYSVDESLGSDFAKKLSSFGTPQQMFENYFNDLIHLVEENNAYRIMKIDHQKCVMRSKEKPEMQEILKTLHVGGRNRCLYRQGALAAATRYLGLPDCHVHETACVFRGDPWCEFQIDFEFATHVQRKLKCH